MFARRAGALVVLIALVACTALAAPTHSARPSSTSPSRPAVTPAKSSQPVPSDDALDKVAAMVNDEAVLASDVEEQLYVFLQRNPGKPDSTQLDTLRHQILDQLIDEKLLLAEAKRQGLSLTDSEIEHGIDQSVADVKERLGGEDAFQEQLKRENTTEAELREKYRVDMKTQLLVRKLVEHQFPRRPVPQAEAEAYFNAHKDKFPKVPGELRLSVIQIPPTPDSVALAAGYAKALAIRKRITSGEKFAKVAQEVSEDPGSAKAGGDLGFFARGTMEKSVEDQAFGLKLGEIGQPVRSSFGWHIVQAIERDTMKTVAGTDSLDADHKPVLETHARHILVRVTPTDADIARARDTATHVLEEVHKGTPFTTLVHRYSHYQGPATPDGDLGFVSLANLQEQIRAGLDSLEIGQVSEVLPNQSGFNIFRVTDRHPEREYTVDEIREELPNAVAQVQFREKYDAWLKTLRSKAQIEYRSY